MFVFSNNMWTSHLFVLDQKGKKKKAQFNSYAKNEKFQHLQVVLWWTSSDPSFETLTGCRCKGYDFSCGMGQSFLPLVVTQQYYDVSRCHTKPGSITCLLYNTAVVLIQNSVCPCLNYSITLSSYSESCTCPSDSLNIVGSVFKNVARQLWGLNHSSSSALQALTKRSLVVRQLNSINIFIWHHRLQFLCASSLRLMKCCH